MANKKRLAQLEKNTPKPKPKVNPYMTMPLNELLAVCVNALNESMSEDTRRVIVDGVKKIKAVRHDNKDTHKAT